MILYLFRARLEVTRLVKNPAAAIAPAPPHPVYGPVVAYHPPPPRPPRPPWDRPEGVPVVRSGPFGREMRRTRPAQERANRKWLGARQALWRALAARRGRPWPSDDPAFESKMLSRFEDDSDVEAGDSVEEALVVPRPPPPPWDRPDAVPVVSSGPYARTPRGVDVDTDNLAWLGARQALWRALAARRGRPWPADDPAFEGFEADVSGGGSVDGEDEAARSPAWLAWLACRKASWRGLAARRFFEAQDAAANADGANSGDHGDNCCGGGSGGGGVGGEGGRRGVAGRAGSAAAASASASSGSTRRGSKRGAEARVVCVLRGARVERLAGVGIGGNGGGGNGGVAIFQSWVFSCGCGLENLANFDDGSEQWECPRCHRWAHGACARAWHRAAYHRRVTVGAYRECFSCWAAEASPLAAEAMALHLRAAAAEAASLPEPSPSSSSSISSSSMSSSKVSSLETCSSSGPEPVHATRGACGPRSAAPPGTARGRSGPGAGPLGRATPPTAAAAVAAPASASSAGRPGNRGRARGGKPTTPPRSAAAAGPWSSLGAPPFAAPGSGGGKKPSAVLLPGTAVARAPPPPSFRVLQAAAALAAAAAAAVDGTVAHSPGGRWLVSEGLPDDALLDVLRFADLGTAATLLRVSLRWARRLRKRDGLWRGLCLRQVGWRGRLPTRPRKRWCDVFLEFLGREEAEVRRRSDEVLRKADAVIRQADNVAALRKLVEAARKAFGFSVDHQSRVLFEANPLLNLSILRGRRPKIAAFLVVECGCSVNLADRGGFTPLMDAAFVGDLGLVRLLLNFGAETAPTGHSHFSGGIKTVEKDAAGWAEAEGHAAVAAHLREWASADPMVLASVKKRALAAARAAAGASARES